MAKVSLTIDGRKALVVIDNGRLNLCDFDVYTELRDAVGKLREADDCSIADAASGARSPRSRSRRV